MTVLSFANRAVRVSERPELTVDLGAVAANTRHFREITGGELMAVVGGPGPDAVDVARTALAHGATRIGVTGLAEALTLRTEGLRAPILSWRNPVDADWARAVQTGVELAVPSLEHLAVISAFVPGAVVHLQLACDLTPDGAAPGLWPALCAAAARAEDQRLIRVAGVMGHLSSTDVVGAASGRDTFGWGLRAARAAGLTPVHRHLAATAATLNDPLSRHTMSRIGAGLIGLDPSGRNRLHPAHTLTAPLVSVRRMPTGDEMGMIELGFADGLPRAASGRAEVMVGGVRRPVAGKISTDTTVIDLGHSGAGPGDPVTLFGPGMDGEPTATEWASWAGTVEHELVTVLRLRLDRAVRSGGAASRW